MNVLVSVIVITYNSAEFVLETLESIKNQVYQNIELIVTDDCSADETVNICKGWIAENKGRFSNVCIVEAKKNTGISSNCNRGLQRAQGDYVKYIAGDDLLLPNCIEDNTKYIMGKNIDFLFSKCLVFESKDEQKEDLAQYSVMQEYNKDKFFNKDVKIQFERLLRGNFIFAASAFLNIKMLKTLNGFDERFIIEDYPLWIKITQKNIKLHYMNIPTVMYRINNQYATTFGGHEFFIKQWLLNDIYSIYKLLRRPYLPFLERINEDLKFHIISKSRTKENKKVFFLLLKLLKYLNPYNYITKMYNIFDGIVGKYR